MERPVALFTLLKATSDDTLMNFLIPIMDVGKSAFFLILFVLLVTPPS
jgi:hypothetical protein